MTEKIIPDWFAVEDIHEKLRGLQAAVSLGLGLTEAQKHFALGRDVRVVGPAALPPKPGLSTMIGQARLLHDLASIECQAMELAVRGLYDFPDAPLEFREQLADLAIAEGRHLQLCLDALQTIGYKWGDWDVHLCLWNAVSAEDSLLDRILIVHRYLEGSGLDAGESILRRLTGGGDKRVRATVKTIVDEEVDHVLFGSVWYRKIALITGIVPEDDFRSRIGRIFQQTPRREKLAREMRYRAGFSENELLAIEEAQREPFQKCSFGPR